MKANIQPLNPAQQTLVVNNMAFAEKLANHLNLCGFPQDELYSEAYLGLCEAAAKFDPNKGASFSTYAYNYIEKYVREYINDKLLASKQQVSIESYYNDADDNHECQLQVRDPYDMEQHACARSSRKYLLNTLRGILTAREYEVICCLYGFDCIAEDERTIAERFSVSRQAINLNKQSALKKIADIPCISQLRFV